MLSLKMNARSAVQAVVNNERELCCNGGQRFPAPLWMVNRAFQQTESR